jgi:hypothetical protein
MLKSRFVAVDPLTWNLYIDPLNPEDKFTNDLWTIEDVKTAKSLTDD